MNIQLSIYLKIFLRFFRSQYSGNNIYKKHLMKTIFLIALLSIGTFQSTSATTHQPLLAYSVSYEEAPSSLKKQKKKHLNKKHKKAKFRSKPKPKQDKNQRGKIITSFILGGVFTLLFVGLAIGAGLVLSSGGIPGIILGIPVVLLALGALSMLIIYFAKGARLLRNKYKSTTKKSDEALKEEVPYLSGAKANKYVALKNQLTAVNINKDNFYRDVRAKQKAGTKFKDLIKELNAINKEHKTLKRAIRKL
ncbi:MAG: hypothetical protein ACI976_000497 [Aureispira sp.]|jgi:hypothetical protein